MSTLPLTSLPGPEASPHQLPDAFTSTEGSSLLRAKPSFSKMLFLKIMGLAPIEQLMAFPLSPVIKLPLTIELASSIWMPLELHKLSSRLLVKILFSDLFPFSHSFPLSTIALQLSCILLLLTVFVEDFDKSTPVSCPKYSKPDLPVPM